VSGNNRPRLPDTTGRTPATLGLRDSTARRSAGAPPNAEAGNVLERANLNLDPVNTGPEGTSSAPNEERVQRFLWPFRFDPNRSVRLIHHHACDAQPLGHQQRVPPETDALYMAAYMEIHMAMPHGEQSKY